MRLNVNAFDLRTAARSMTTIEKMIGLRIVDDMYGEDVLLDFVNGNHHSSVKCCFVI